MEFVTLSKAISSINDGSLITFSGMELNRAPMALIYEIVKQRKKGLKTVSIPNPIATDVLINAGCVEHATFGFNGFSFEDGFVIAPNWRNAVENGTIQWKETDILEIILALKAGAKGIKEIEVPHFYHTDYLRFNNYKKIDNKIFTAALNPDFALIHAQYADRNGNVLVEDPLIDKLIADASKNVIVSVEKIVDKIDEITIPKEKIKFIVELKGGASPTSCFKFYNYDPNKIREYINKSSTHNNKGEYKPDASQTSSDYIDHMIITLASFIKEGSIVATGVASPIPLIATMFAKKSGKRFNYFNCGSGAINPIIKSLPYSSVTINVLEQYETFIELSEVWDYAMSGKVDLMFFGAVQISKKGDVNVTCIGDYNNPKVKLPGPAGAVTLRNLCKNTIITTQHHTKKTFVKEVDFITSGTEKDTIVVTNLGVLKLGKEVQLISVFPHSSIKEIESNTDFPIDKYPTQKPQDLSQEDLKLLNGIDPVGLRYKLT